MSQTIRRERVSEYFARLKILSVDFFRRYDRFPPCFRERCSALKYVSGFLCNFLSFLLVSVNFTD